MSNVEELKEELAAALTEFRAAPHFFRLEADEHLRTGMEMGVTAANTGHKILQTVLQAILPTYLSYVHVSKEAADTCHDRVKVIGVPTEGEPHVRITAALEGTSQMSDGFEKAAATTETMRERLTAALGHLTGFAVEMEEFDRLRWQLNSEESLAMTGGIYAANALEAYIATLET